MSNAAPIVVGLDGGEASVAALEFALREAKLRGTHVRALSCWPSEDRRDDSGPLLCSTHAQATEVLNHVIEQGAAPGPRCVVGRPRGRTESSGASVGRGLASCPAHRAGVDHPRQPGASSRSQDRRALLALRREPGGGRAVHGDRPGPRIPSGACRRSRRCGRQRTPTSGGSRSGSVMCWQLTAPRTDRQASIGRRFLSRTSVTFAPDRARALAQTMEVDSEGELPWAPMSWESSSWCCASS
ncbi:MAG: hypothetical protein JWR27_1158 [Aeromicrobium sp.]|jgi:hypothetical protein|nr:hypothetical protein [Aeromicrobium sp.]